VAELLITHLEALYAQLAELMQPQRQLIATKVRVEVLSPTYMYE